MTHEEQIFDSLTDTEKRAMVLLQNSLFAPAPFSAESFEALACQEGRLADVLGIPDEEIGNYIIAGEKLIDAQNWSKAMQIFEAVIGIDPMNPLAYLGLGIVKLEAARFNQAELLFTAAIEVFGGDIGGYAGRAIARLEQGDTAGAEEDMLQALELDPEGEAAPLTCRMAACFVEHHATLSA